jgi:superfamily II DNA or RNA helicase
LFVTPRKFITFQGAEEAENMLGKSKIAYINSKFPKNKIRDYISNKQVIVMDLQTAYNRAKEGLLSRKNFNAIVIDEAHYSSKKTVDEEDKVVDKLKKLFPKVPKLNVTATPFDETGRYLSTLGFIDDRFDSAYMAKNGYLSNIIFLIADIYLRNKTVAEAYKKHLVVKNGVATESSIARATNSKAGKILTNTALHYTFTHKEVIKRGERALVYAGSIEQAEFITEQYQRQGHNAKVLHSKIDNPIGLIQNFNNQKFDVLVSVDMLVMGVAVKNVKKSILYRGISSRITYQQLTARGSGGDAKYTALPNIIVDFTDTYSKMGHPHDFKPYWKEKNKKEPLRCPKCNCNLKDYPLTIVSDKHTNIVKKQCTICGNIKETLITNNKKTIYIDSFNLVVGKRREQIIEMKNNYIIKQGIKRVVKILKSRNLKYYQVEKMLFLYAKKRGKQDKHFFIKLFKIARVENLNNIIKFIQGVVI